MARILLPFLLVFAAGTSFQQPVSVQNVPSKLFPATVEISVKEKKDEEYFHVGTGWLYNDQTTVVTAKHVVDGFDDEVTDKEGKSKIQHFPYESIRITFSDGEKVVVTKVQMSKTWDVASLTFKTDKIREPLKLADKRGSIGDKLFGAGFPLDYKNPTLMVGYVTSYQIGDSGQFLGKEYMMTNAMFIPGHSGGPIVNESGDVIGMVDWIDQRSAALSFAVPVDTIQKAILEFK